MLAISPCGLTPDAWRQGEQQLGAKKNGVLHRAPLEAAEELPLLRGLLLRALGSFLRHCFLLRISDPASDEPLGRHNWWAEPSTLIPDVDYG